MAQVLAWFGVSPRPLLGLALIGAALIGAALAAYHGAGQAGLLALALAGLGALAAARLAAGAPGAGSVSDQIIARLDAGLRDRGRTGRQTGCFVLQFDAPDLLCDRIGRSRQSDILSACIARLRGALRPGDVLYRLEDGGLAVVLAPTDRLALEAMVRIAGRLQLVVEQPLHLGGAVVHLTSCIGFCHSGQVAGDGRALLDAAQIAVDEALRHRPGAIRGYTDDLARGRADRDALRAAFPAAVAAGEVRAHFQPQLSTDSGTVSGMEALVRWHHPLRGCLGPGDFMPALDGTDGMVLLGAAVLDQALAAVAAWDRAGFAIPSVAVNLSAPELRDAALPERLAAALQRHGLAPARLTVEVLESVVAQDDDDIIARNIRRIGQLGCGVDLDDFGTGNASITSIRRFALRRLKIDRSFVRGIDTDRDQHALVTAILSLADRLGLDTLAEGVETPGEHATLAQLGCGHVQGYAIARPLPPEAVLPWLAQHRDRLAQALRIGVRAR
jgi:EAL domain-containing protein (putative c-di-GMP-specific phosphodiesterase class I)/GGDEF domain-containing protein